MYRLIIVDDEWEALKGMRDTLPWEQWGFEVTGVEKKPGRSSRLTFRMCC